MAIGQAWWETLNECDGLLQSGDIATSRLRLRTLFRCIKAAAEPEILELLDADDRAELQRLARGLRAVWRRAQHCWLLRN